MRKTPLPGLVSGGLLIVYGIYQFFVRFPRAAREAEAIEQTRRKKGAARG